MSKANRRAVGFGFVVTGIIVLLVKWVSYFLTDTIYNSNYQYIEYVGYGIIALGAVYLIGAEISSLRERNRLEGSDDIWEEIDTLRERAQPEGSSDTTPGWSNSENRTS